VQWRSALGPTNEQEELIPLEIKQPGHEAGHSSPSNAEVKNE